MSGTQPTPGEDPAPGRVQIRVRGHLEARWSSWLEGLTLTRQDDGTTVLEGPVVDQAALFGIIDRLRDMALPLISVAHLEPPYPPSGAGDQPRAATGPPPTSSRPRSTA